MSVDQLPLASVVAVCVNVKLPGSWVSRSGAVTLIVTVAPANAGESLPVTAAAWLLGTGAGHVAVRLVSAFGGGGGGGCCSGTPFTGAITGAAPSVSAETWSS